MRVGTSRPTVRYWTENKRTRFDVLFGEGGLHLEERRELEVLKNITLLWPSVCFQFWLGIANARCSICAVENTALVVGMVELRATGTYASANPQKNLRRGQHAQGGRSEIDPKRVPVSSIKC